jgi:membrane protein
MDGVHPIGADRRTENGRSCSVRRPAAIPARGWAAILWRVLRGISDDRILMNAAAVTFYALLALFPAIAAIVSIYGLFADPARISNQLNALSGILPGGGITVIRNQLTRLVAKGSGPLSLGFALGLLVSLWSANGGVSGLFDALNVVYGEREKRSLVTFYAVSLAFTVAMIGFAIVAVACVVAVPAVLAYLPGFIATVIDIARWPLLAVLVAVVLAVIYRYGPSRERPRWRWISGGSAAAARRLRPLFVLRGEFRHVRQDLRLARRDHRLHAVDLAVGHHHPARRQAQCRDRAAGRA